MIKNNKQHNKKHSIQYAVDDIDVYKRETNSSKLFLISDEYEITQSRLLRRSLIAFGSEF